MFNRSPETATLVEVFSQLAPGESITTQALADRVGFEIENHAYAAREAMRRAGDGVVDYAKGVFTRLTDAECVNRAAPRYKQKARSAIRRGATSLKGVNYNSLSDRDRSAHNVHLATFGALELVSSAKSQRKLTQAIGSAPQFNARDALRLFGGDK